MSSIFEKNQFNIDEIESVDRAFSVLSKKNGLNNIYENKIIHKKMNDHKNMKSIFHSQEHSRNTMRSVFEDNIFMENTDELNLKKEIHLSKIKKRGFSL